MSFLRAVYPRATFIMVMVLAGMLAVCPLTKRAAAQNTPQPVTKTLSIILTQPLTDTGLAVTQGESITVTATGMMNFYTGFTGVCTPSCITTPDGRVCPYTGFYAPALACYSLIGQIGNGTPFFVGSSLQNFLATSSGELFLGVNDNNYPDNTGDWTAMIQLATPSCTITSQTLATVPGVDNSRTSVGVGESVLLTSSVAATWTVASGGYGLLAAGTEATTGFPSNAGFPSEQCSTTLSPDPISGSQACFTAPYSTDDSVITATLADGSSCSTKLHTVQPTGLIFQRMESPPLQKPGYVFIVFPNVFYRIGMISDVFLTPADVSFVNIRISEHDVPMPYLAPQFNKLFTVSGTDPQGNAFSTNGWLVSCDIDVNLVAHKNFSFTSAWVYLDRNGGHETEFSLTETFSNHASASADFYYSKGQIQALTTDGSLQSTPNAPSSNLTVPRSVVYQNIYFPGSSNVSQCLNYVEQQFPLVQ